jgi:hypothetical protein
MLWLIEVGLEHAQKPKRRGPKDRWGDGRYIHLHLAVCTIRDELQDSREEKVTIPEAIAELRKRAPKIWPSAQNSLETKFHEAERRLKDILASYEW